MMKKLVLIATLLALLLCTTALADQCGDYEYDVLQDGTACITKYNGWDSTLTIPDKLNGVTVSKIGDKAFYLILNLKSVIFPDCVTSIGDHAFSDCKSLTSVTISNSVQQMGVNPFSQCQSLHYVSVSPNHPVFATINGVLFNKQSKTLIWYPMTATQTSYEIPKGIKEIGDMAFSFCDSLTSVTIPDSVTFIGNSAFSGCTNLTSITIPDSVTSIGNNAFFCCFELTSVTIPDSVTFIGYFAFSSCESLTSVSIPDSVTSIGNSAFSFCPNLVITVNPGSFAEQYAQKKNIPCKWPEASTDWLNE